MVKVKKEDLIRLLRLIIQHTVLTKLETADPCENAQNHISLNEGVTLYSNYAVITVVIDPSEDSYQELKKNLKEQLKNTDLRLCLSPMDIRQKTNKHQKCQFIVTFLDIQVY